MQHWFMVVLMLAKLFQIWRHGNFKTKKFFGDTECLKAVNVTLVYGCFNVGKTIPDLGTTHSLPWVGCEFGDTRIGCFNTVNVVQGCIKNQTQTPTHQQKFVFCKLFKNIYWI